MSYQGQAFATPEEALAHYGVKGMKWGVHRERTPEQQLARINKKISRIDANTAIEGISLQGWALKKQYKRSVRKDPAFKFNKLPVAEQERRQRKATNRVRRSVALRGAAEIAVILGGTALLANKVGSSPQAKNGALVSAAILSGKVGKMRIEQLHQLNVGVRLQRLQRERDQLTGGR
jgi:hypothetical protein